MCARPQEQQTPQDFGLSNKAMKLSDTHKPGINLAHQRILLDWKSGSRFTCLADPEAPPWPDESPADAERFQNGIDAAALLPEQPQTPSTR